MNAKIDKSLQYRSYLTPGYWPLWFAVGLLRVIACLPLFILQPLGSALGILIYHLISSRRRVARINLKLAFPEMGDDEINRLNKMAFRSLGISVFEMGAAWFKGNSLEKKCQIEGLENLEQAMTHNTGIILLTGHFTTLETGARLIGPYCKKFNGVFKKAHDPLFNAFMVNSRKKHCNLLIENKNVREIIRRLKADEAIWLAPDQDFADQDIVFTPFLGSTASTLTATAKLSRLTGAPVVPYYPVRLDRGRGYKLVVLPALKNFPTDDIEADSARINKTIEDMVYACPEQYLWSHKRFKTQPDRVTNIYKK